MGDESLSPAQKYEYRFLKQQVNSLEEERYRYDARPNIQQDLFHAREDLKSFVSKPVSYTHLTLPTIYSV